MNHDYECAIKYNLAIEEVHLDDFLMSKFYCGVIFDVTKLEND